MTSALESTGEDYLLFLLSGERYGVPIGVVREVVRLSPVTPVPGARSDILGVMNVRGRILTLFDLRRALEVAAPPPDPRNRALLTMAGEEEVAALVDEILGVLHVTPEQFEPAGALGGGDRPHLRGIARQGKSLVVLLDLPVLIDADHSPRTIAPPALEGGWGGR
ncbi:MAG: chemotaxis protein CheW [Polyangiaceae bacterium]